ncbi:hypothetical protein CHS0354_026527 [Potamilus streckersoni]|uniref:Uncharacterized protein n=1 Tax=Potamilus streckersoni TaxID=2493646 RepID=A0AAE0VGM7_9BIVA|nr:hypothetical protein CHS0354_026527 [Potamilus streckersoni]
MTIPEIMLLQTSHGANDNSNFRACQIPKTLLHVFNDYLTYTAERTDFHAYLKKLERTKSHLAETCSETRLLQRRAHINRKHLSRQPLAHEERGKMDTVHHQRLSRYGSYHEDTITRDTEPGQETLPQLDLTRPFITAARKRRNQATDLILQDKIQKHLTWGKQRSATPYMSAEEII